MVHGTRLLLHPPFLLPSLPHPISLLPSPRLHKVVN